MSESFNFAGSNSAEPIKVGPFNIGTGNFILREASEDAYTAYRNISMKSMKLVEGNTTVSDGGQEADTVLVQRCLFEVLTNGVEVPTKIDFVRGLPRRITKPLYTKVREISNMDEEEETVEVLTKRIAADTKKVDVLKSKETPAKND